MESLVAAGGVGVEVADDLVAGVDGDVVAVLDHSDGQAAAAVADGDLEAADRDHASGAHGDVADRSWCRQRSTRGSGCGGGSEGGRRCLPVQGTVATMVVVVLEEAVQLMVEVDEGVIGAVRRACHSNCVGVW